LHASVAVLSKLILTSQLCFQYSLCTALVSLIVMVMANPQISNSP